MFLRAGAVRWYCPRAKDEKRQTAVRIRYPYRCFLLVSLCQNGTARMPSPTKENAILHTFVLAWFSRFYRQSENRHPNACSLFVSAHNLFHSKTPLALLPIFENYLSICHNMNKTSIHNLLGTQQQILFRLFLHYLLFRFIYQQYLDNIPPTYHDFRTIFPYYHNGYL